MVNHSRATAQPLVPGMRRMLVLAGVLVFLVGISLYLLTEQTERYFAWTIKSNLTAAFLGASYWASCVLEFAAARQRLWAHARVAVPAVITFTALTLVVTLVHMDRFHFGVPDPLTRAGTWFWLAVYVSVPVIMSALLVRQLRAPGEDPPRTAPMPGWMAGMLAFNAVVLILPGIALLLLPEVLMPAWPWALTPLTGRAIGAWLIGLGIAAGQGARERDTLRARPMLISAVVFCVLQAVALARYPDEVAWGSLGSLIMVGFLALVLLVSVAGLLASRGATPGAALAGGRER